MKKIKLRYGLYVVASIVLFASCSPRHISEKYYYENAGTLDKIEESYKKLYKQKPFTIAFTGRDFQIVSVEIITDTLSYIYEFTVNEPRLTDTLKRFHFDDVKVNELIGRMQSIRCAWINNYDFYEGEKENSLIFMSIKPVALKALFSYSKYYILTYFSQPQHFDSEGRLLDQRRTKRLQKINGEIFHRINDKVCYTVSGKFR